MLAGARRRARGSLGHGTHCSVLLLFGGFAAACQTSTSEQGAEATAPIIGGELDTTHKGVVSLLKQVQGGFYPACSGTLLTQNLVLTAHHCVASLSSSDGASVECGETEFLQTDKASSLLVSIEANVGREGLQPYEVAKIWVPTGGSGVCGRDIALLLLEGAGVAASSATPISPRLTNEVTSDQVFAAIGYGLQDPEDQEGRTAGHRMGVTDAQVFCAGAACDTDLIHDSEWIAASPVCSGDSGGPALSKDGQVVGVTSRGDADCTLGIYTSVYAWRDFIREKTFEAAESGRYLPPAWAGEPPPDFDPGVPAGGSAGSGGAGGQSGGSGAPTIAGGPSSGGKGSGAPIVDPLGIECSGQCPGAYRCWSESGQPPGICVPTCSAEKACPTAYTCNDGLGACVPDSAVSKATVDESSGCGVSAAGGGASGWAAALGILGGVLLRRTVRGGGRYRLRRLPLP